MTRQGVPAFVLDLLTLGDAILLQIPPLVPHGQGNHWAVAQASPDALYRAYAAQQLYGDEGWGRIMRMSAATMKLGAEACHEYALSSDDQQVSVAEPDAIARGRPEHVPRARCEKSTIPACGVSFDHKLRGPPVAPRLRNRLRMLLRSPLHRRVLSVPRATLHRTAFAS